MTPRLIALRLGFLLPLLVFAALWCVRPAAAGHDDQDAVRQAVESGAIRPLADILNGIRGQLPGDIVGIEIDRKKSHWVYELRVLGKSGRLFEVYVGAATGAIERTKEK